MKILLISPTVDCETRTKKGLMIPPLALFILQGLTPKEHQVRIIEEEIEKIDLEQECNLVGISCMTANAARAYELCQEFKKRGKTIILGGVHPTILPEEALQYADSVVVGEAEGVWEKLLDDFQNNRLKQIYHDPVPDLTKHIRKDYSKINKNRLFKIIPIMTSRGCPYNCDFCCVSHLFGKTIKHVPIENVVRDIKESGSKNFIFLDDNIIGDIKYAKALFSAIKPLKINWIGQASISLFVNDADLIPLASESGCKGLFFGIESISKESLKSMPKAIKDNELLERAFKKIKKANILVQASIIFGFDSDTNETFHETLKFLIKNKIHIVSFNILTPYPGTKIHEQLKEANRLITTDWRYYDHNTVVFKPMNMTPYQLQVAKFTARKKFYDIFSILRRLRGNLYSPLIYLAMNYAHMRQVKIEGKRIATLEAELFEK